jgi:hypothetical protein
MTFDKAYMTHRMHISWRGPIIADALTAILAPHTVLDLGCATGDITAGFLGAGVEAWGVDNSTAAHECLPPERRVLGNLRLPPTCWIWPDSARDVEAPVDLVILLEVLSVVTPEPPCALHGDTVEAARAQVLHNATNLGRTLLVNHLDEDLRAMLRGRQWTRDMDAQYRLQHLLEQWSKKQAVKALYDTGEIWRRA